MNDSFHITSTFDPNGSLSLVSYQGLTIKLTIKPGRQMSGNTQAALAANLEMNENILSEIHSFVDDARFVENYVLFETCNVLQ